MEANRRIPVTILTGFLGSGKTTLLNKLISKHNDKKLAIIENEFGEISIDSELVIKSNEGIFELSNGCICCSLNDDLNELLTKIYDREQPVDHLIIETTGIADPGPIALNFITDYKIQHMYRLDGIVTLVDARFIETQLENEAEASKQIAMADIVLLNKTDTVEKYQIDTVKNIIAKLNSQAQVVETQFGDTGEFNLLEINGFQAESVQKTQFETKPVKKFSLNKQAVNQEQSLMDEKRHLHKSGVSSVSFVFEGPLDVLKLDAWLNVMLNWGTGLFYRGKGILYVEDYDKKVVFQSVLNQFVTEAGEPWGNEPKLNKIVFIGRHLDKEALEKGLQMCVVNDVDAASEDFFESIMELQDAIYSKMKNS